MLIFSDINRINNHQEKLYIYRKTDKIKASIGNKHQLRLNIVSNITNQTDNYP